MGTLNPVVRESCSMVAVGPSVQKDWLLVAQIVTAGIERCSVQMDYWSFGFVESRGAQICLCWAVEPFALCFDQMHCLKVAAEHLVARICQQWLDLIVAGWWID